MDDSTDSTVSVSLLHDESIVITGEEDEDVIYSQRAQLLHFYESAWHKRGLGTLKILKHQINGKYRVVMRHEDINEPVCLNHMLKEDIEYKAKDAKSWYFVVNDYSEGEYEIRQLCLRFKTSEVAEEFKAAVDAVLERQNETQAVDDTPLSPEEEQQRIITLLKLPPDFFEYEKKSPCPGCCGCNSDEYEFPSAVTNCVFVADENPIPLHLKAKIVIEEASKISSSTPDKNANSCIGNKA